MSGGLFRTTARLLGARAKRWERRETITRRSRWKFCSAGETPAVKKFTKSSTGYGTRKLSRNGIPIKVFLRCRHTALPQFPVYIFIGQNLGKGLRQTFAIVEINQLYACLDNRKTGLRPAIA